MFQYWEQTHGKKHRGETRLPQTVGLWWEAKNHEDRQPTWSEYEKASTRLRSSHARVKFVARAVTSPNQRELSVPPDRLPRIVDARYRKSR